MTDFNSKENCRDKDTELLCAFDRPLQVLCNSPIPEANLVAGTHTHTLASGITLHDQTVDSLQPIAETIV